MPAFTCGCTPWTVNQHVRVRRHAPCRVPAANAAAGQEATTSSTPEVSLADDGAPSGASETQPKEVIPTHLKAFKAETTLPDRALQLKLRDCRTPQELIAVDDERVPYRNALELAMVVYHMRRVCKRQDAEGDPAVRKRVFQLREEAKEAMFHLLPDAFASLLFNLYLLRGLDKIVLARASNVLFQRIRDVPRAYAPSELSQALCAFAAYKFKRPRLKRAIAAAVVAFVDIELDALSASNLLNKMSYLGMEGMDAPFQRLALYLEYNANRLNSQHLLNTFKALARVRFEGSDRVSETLQASLRRQKANHIGPLTCCKILEGLLDAGTLQKETAVFLLSVLDQEDRLEGTVKAVLVPQLPALAELGFEVPADILEQVEGLVPETEQDPDKTSDTPSLEEGAPEARAP